MSWSQLGTACLKRAMPEIVRGRVIMRVATAEQANTAEGAGRVAVTGKAGIGHFAETQVLQSLGVNYIDESEVLIPDDYSIHIDKWALTVPFVCAATNLGAALRRITEGAAIIRAEGAAGEVSNTVTHMRTIRTEIRRLGGLTRDEPKVSRGLGEAMVDINVDEIPLPDRLPERGW